MWLGLAVDRSEMAVAGVTVVLEVSVAEILTCLCCHLLSGQSPPESPWGLLTWRLLLARASCYPARLPAIQLWMSLSRGHSTASSSTSSETAIILKEWAGWVMSSIKLRYFPAILGLIGTRCVMREGMLHSPAESFSDPQWYPTERFTPRFVHLKVSPRGGFVSRISKRRRYHLKSLICCESLGEWQYRVCNRDPYLLKWVAAVCYTSKNILVKCHFSLTEGPSLIKSLYFSSLQLLILVPQGRTFSYRLPLP